MLIAAVAAFPVNTEWDDDGHRVSGLVPAAQALLTPVWPESAWPGREDVPFAVELRDSDPVGELSQAGEAATSGAAVAIGV